MSIYAEEVILAGVQSAGERYKTLTHELQRQNDELEEQRLRLLRQLRINAEQISTNVRGFRGRHAAVLASQLVLLPRSCCVQSLKYYGLTGEQMMLVNAFAEKLREEGACVFLYREELPRVH